MSWLKLVIHPEHDKILRISDLTGTSPEVAFAAVVRWFRWVDGHADGPCPQVSLAGFRTICRWPDDGLAEAMQDKDVDWLRADGERFGPTRVKTHFGGGAKRRCLEAARKTSARYADKKRTPKRTECAPEQNQTRPEKSEPSLVLTKPSGDVRKAVERLRVSGSVGRAVQNLANITPFEIAKVVEEVRESEGVEDVGIVAAKVLLERRGQSLPARKSRPLSGPLAEAASGVSGLADIVRRRQGRNA